MHSRFSSLPVSQCAILTKRSTASTPGWFNQKLRPRTRGFARPSYPQNESEGTIPGDFIHEFKITEDPTLTQDLLENAPVVVELPLDCGTAMAVRGGIPEDEFVPVTIREALCAQCLLKSLTNTTALIRWASLLSAKFESWTDPLHLATQFLNDNPLGPR